MPETTPHDLDLDLVQISGDIVGAYVRKNVVPARDLPALLASVHAAFVVLTLPDTAAESLGESYSDRPTPAQIRKSITHEHLISFEDGKRYKTLRRHLTLRGLSPEAYRAKWGLPLDYPMTSPSYSEQRSELAKAVGLGRPGSRAERQATE